MSNKCEKCWLPNESGHKCQVEYKESISDQIMNQYDVVGVSDAHHYQVVFEAIFPLFQKQLEDVEKIFEKSARYDPEMLKCLFRSLPKADLSEFTEKYAQYMDSKDEDPKPKNEADFNKEDPKNEADEDSKLIDKPRAKWQPKSRRPLKPERAQT